MTTATDKATPGPWAVEPHWLHIIPESHLGRPFGGSIVDDDDRNNYMQTIAAVRDYDRHGRGDAMANARLIAAAPDLLAACRQVSEFLSSHCGCDECWGQMHAIRAAIAKAESTP
jgi:hypothetical protein